MVHISFIYKKVINQIRFFNKALVRVYVFLIAFKFMFVSSNVLFLHVAPEEQNKGIINMKIKGLMFKSAKKTERYVLSVLIIKKKLFF